MIGQRLTDRRKGDDWSEANRRKGDDWSEAN